MLLLMSSAWPQMHDAPKPLRLLLLTGRNNHDWRETTPVLVDLYEQSGRFTVDVTEDPAALTAKDLAPYDVVVSNWCAWPEVEERAWGADTEEALIEFVRGGKGFALFHAASATFQTWPEFQQLIGSTWALGKTGHGAIHRFNVEVTENAHPVTQGMPPFSIRDELWHDTGKQPAIHVLCEAFSAKDKGGSGKNEPVVLCTQFGEGRGFNLVLGHDARTMRNRAWQTLMLRGTEWAATGTVTIPIPENWPKTRPAKRQADETPGEPENE
ncbi:MAG: hypothetical protein GWP08_17770 [Nitrospiraceae bacterium]|nr:hypothetical protein [Nitrospiraceae bacterium]